MAIDPDVWLRDMLMDMKTDMVSLRTDIRAMVDKIEDRLDDHDRRLLEVDQFKFKLIGMGVASGAIATLIIDVAMMWMKKI